MRRVFILTASFGEGHNTAAKNIRDALILIPNTEVEISDLYQITNPFLNEIIRQGYGIAINRYPHLWNLVFRLLSTPGLLELSLPTLRALEEALQDKIKAFQPDVIVSSYPVYSFLMRRIQRADPARKLPPFITVITDSTGINSAWYRCHSTYFITTDISTKAVLEKGGVPPEIIKTLGFPVDLRFEHLSPIPPTPPEQWRVLYMPSTRRHHTLQTLQQLLTIPNVSITVLTGRNEALASMIRETQLVDSGRLEIVGWTSEMPALFASHHLYLGKAGGAVVQEAIAAKCPFIVSHFVPGQEEGNMALIENFEIGCNATGTIATLLSALQSAITNNGKLWQRWKYNIEAISRPDASRRAAEFILEVTEEHGQT